MAYFVNLIGIKVEQTKEHERLYAADILVVQSGPKLLELDVGKFEVEGLQEFDQMIWQHELVVLEAVDREKLLRVEVGFFDSRFE